MHGPGLGFPEDRAITAFQLSPVSVSLKHVPKPSVWHGKIINKNAYWINELSLQRIAESLQEKGSRMRLSGKGTVEGFKQEHDRAYFHFLKGYPGCPEEQEL